MRSAVVTKAIVVGVAALIAIAIFARMSSSGPSGPPEISVVDAYASESTSDASALYLTLRNDGGGDHLVGVIAGGAGSVTIHDAAMAPQNRLAVKGHAKTELAPGGTHIMLERLARPLRPGGQVGVRLLFEHSAPIDVTAQVLSYDQVNAKAGA